MTVNEIPAVVGTSSTQVATVAKNRYSFLISAPSQFRVSLSFRGPAVLDKSLTIYPGQNPIYLCRDDYGDLMDYGLFAIAPNAQSLNIIEAIM